ncbi:MAG TPA: hypothetical protein PKL13_02780 [bacterium]|nr:hypothetical protein [bacterium]
MKKYLIMGVVVSVLSLGLAFVMSINKPNTAEAQQNKVQNRNNIEPSGCGCQKKRAGDCGCTENNKCGNFVDENNDGKCDRSIKFRK